MRAKNTSGGAEVTRTNIVRISLDNIEKKQLKQIKEHYGFEKEADVFRALIKRASLSLPIKGVKA